MFSFYLNHYCMCTKGVIRRPTLEKFSLQSFVTEMCSLGKNIRTFFFSGMSRCNTGQWDDCLHASMRHVRVYCDGNDCFWRGTCNLLGQPPS
jgi:hypothetical protein